jgi:tetratricopeptide (TPR) repeat protein
MTLINRRGYFVRGDSCEAKGEYQKAIEDLSTGLRLYPNNAEGLSRRGEAYERLGERAKALADFKAALAIEPGSGMHGQDFA